VCGLLAAVVAMGIGQLLAGLTVPAASPVVAVGDVAINHTPLAVKDWATTSFGTADKTVLLAGVLVVVLLYAAVVGVLALRRLSAGFAGLAVFAALGLAAALTRHGASGSYALPTLFGAAAGALALDRLVRRARMAAAAGQRARAARAPAPLPPIEFRPDEPAAKDSVNDATGWVAVGDPPADQTADDRPPPARPGPMRAGPPAAPARLYEAGADAAPQRRQFLLAAGASVAAAAIGEVAGRTLSTSKNVSAAEKAIRLPRAADPAAALPRGVNLNVPGISSFVTPNSKFYRVDTAIIVPEVDPANWTLRIHGMVEREVSLTFDQLLRKPLIEDYITLTCVSNPVGGPYAGNAKWLGASLAALIRSARPRAGADQLLCTSSDGFTSGTPLSVVLEGGQDALLAVGMNGTVLPTEHGFPARLVVPGLYGYVSACKWVVDIEVTTFAAAQGYWVPRGWSQQGPIKTESRIDVPLDGTSLKAGQRTPVAGVAWAQHKGIEAVEVRVDQGQWQEATLAAVPGIDTWRQWVWEWDASSGTHTIEARATDKTGYTQTSLVEGEAPDGASGYPSTQVSVA
jgi:DMSO/TMAO reductase YedYZ molybdopterin-dependent catalytic subunit